MMGASGGNMLDALFSTLPMKKIPLSQGKFALVDDADYDYLMQWKWSAKKEAKTFYAARAAKNNNGRKTTIVMHREILQVTDIKTNVDHKDHDGLNNQRSNLRICNRTQNGQNKQAIGRGSSKYKGVTWNKKKNVFYAEIMANGKRGCLGTFQTGEAAALAYNEAAKKYHGEFACLNVIEHTTVEDRTYRAHTRKNKSLSELRRIYRQGLIDARLKGEATSRTNMGLQSEDYFKDWLGEMQESTI